jgi:hypothetical protein
MMLFSHRFPRFVDALVANSRSLDHSPILFEFPKREAPSLGPDCKHGSAT